MRHSVSRDLHAYWDRLRGARAAPDRSDIDPAAIRQVLADTFILEIDSSCAFPFRLCGTRLNALWQCEQKGRSFLELWRKEDRRNVAAALLTVIDGVTPIVAGAGAFSSTSDRAMDMELLLLPLRHYGKTHSRLLGSLAAFDHVSWFGRTPASTLELKSLRVVTPQAPAAICLPPLSGMFAGSAAKGRPRLVVYEGGKPTL